MIRKEIAEIQTIIEDLCNDACDKEDIIPLIEEVLGYSYSEGFNYGYKEAKNECRKAKSCNNCTNRFVCWTER